MSRSRRTLSLLLCALLISVSACGGVPAYRAGDDQVVIALVCSNAGAGDMDGARFHQAAALAQEQVNAAGGVAGRTLVLESFDSKNSPVAARTIAEALTRRSDVLCVVSDGGNGCAEAAAPIYEAAGIPQIVPQAASDAFSAAGVRQFSAAPSRSAEAAFDMETVMGGYLDARSVGVLYTSSNDYAAALGAFETAAEANGIEVRIKEGGTPGQTSFKAIVRRMKQTNPDCVYLLCGYSEALKCLQEIRIQQWDVPVVVTGSRLPLQADNLLGTGLGKVLSRRLVTSGTSRRELDDFLSAAGVADGEAEPDLLVYDTIKLLSYCASKADAAGSLTREGLLDAMGSGVLSFGGLLGDVVFDEAGSAQRAFDVMEHGRRWEIALSSVPLGQDSGAVRK